MNKGFILLHRKIMESAVWQNEGLLKVWIWCLLKANHKTRWVSVNTGGGTKPVEVKRGQFIYGRYMAARELKMQPSTVRNRIKKLEKLQNLDTLKDTHYTLVTVRYYDTYQNLELVLGQAKGQAEDKLRTQLIHDNKLKQFKPPTLDEISNYASEKGYKINVNKFFSYYERTGWKLKGQQITNWQAALDYWAESENNKNGTNGRRTTGDHGKTKTGKRPEGNADDSGRSVYDMPAAVINCD